MASCNVSDVTPNVVSYPPANDVPARSSSGDDKRTATIPKLSVKFASEPNASFAACFSKLVCSSPSERIVVHCSLTTSQSSFE